MNNDKMFIIVNIVCKTQLISIELSSFYDKSLNKSSTCYPTIRTNLNSK